ncbi:MAG: histidine phosphatase family protein [Cyanobacteria bacterium J06627_28]
MKKLHFIRHAKSSWRNAYLADIDRPLNERGVRSCQVMAAQIVKAGCPLDNIFCSPAVRAQSTIEHINEAIVDRELSWTTDRRLYTFDVRDLLNWCRELDDELAEVTVVGHNNALTDFVNSMSDRTIENLPTCGYAQLTLREKDWRSLSPNSVRLTDFLKPKMFLPQK